MKEKEERGTDSTEEESRKWKKLGLFYFFLIYIYTLGASYPVITGCLRIK